MTKKLLNHLILLLFTLGLLPVSGSSQAAGIEVVVEEPQLHPPYTTCQESYWYPFANNRGHTAYLTLNVDKPANSTNHGEWHPVIPQDGYYRVEAYIPAHSPITWCTGQNPPTIAHDTTDAHYTIYHSNGSTERKVSQYPLRDQWLDLGEYYFKTGTTGYISLTDLNTEANFSTTVSFSAMRFIFTRLTRPKIYLPLIGYSDPSGRPPPDAGILQAQGFDACHLPEISEMQTWWNKSPYDFYALYLGGIHLPSICTVASAAWVSSVHKQGWSFVPTWVGPQAPCSPYSKKMSTDPAISYQQGRQEAQAASSAAVSLGLTNHDWGGTVIYYDMEVFGGASTACRQAASAFMNGWVERLHELDNIAGGYGAHNSYVEDWATIAHVPDDIWAASWYTDTYDPYASVYTVPWLNGLWVNHQRIRQYAGDVSNTWGGVSLAIDINVADGMVAMPPNRVLSAPEVTIVSSIEDAGWLSADQGWVVSGQRLYRTDDWGREWHDISPAPVQRVYFLSPLQGWAVSTRNTGEVDLYATSDGGTSWEIYKLPLPPDAWRSLQLQFSSPSSGWVVMKKVTSQAFDVGVLMKTEDSGLTWQSYELPVTGEIRFTTPQEGWLTSSTQNLYHSLDGGLTWQPDRRESIALEKSPLPQGAFLSGWGEGGLGWAVTSHGECSGEKSAPGFSCRATASLWQTLDEGISWQNIIIPGVNQTER